MYRLATVELELGAHIQCYSPPELAIHDGDQCVFENDRIQDFGRIIAVTECQDTNPCSKLPSIIRCATLQDQSKAKEVQLMSKMAMDTCIAKVEKFKLDMHLVRVKYSFDRKVLMVTFSAEERVDFRSLVKELASELHTRIEMKQIGVRDEASMIGGIGPCGRVLCCTDWLKHFESINVKMAKTQRLSLNPGAISGMCGRLKCCLKYENEQYKACSRAMPRDGSTVETPEGRGRIIDQNVPQQKVTVRLENEQTVEYGIGEIRTIREFRKRFESITDRKREKKQ